jgi:predicted dienelactone hydrolase
MVHPLIRRLSGICLVLAILSSAPANSGAAEGAVSPLFNVGYRVLDLKYTKDGKEQTITVAVWYPAAAQPKSHNYGGPTSGNVAVDAAPYAEGGPYPFLVFSHGYGGSGLGAVFFTEALAARGWVVAAPDHHDRHSAVRIRTGEVKDCDRRSLLKHALEIAASSREDRGEYLYRLDEIKAVLDRMPISEPFKGIIDTNRIAVGGHSFGGFTALGVCGTIPQRLDSRIKAVLLFSTGAGGYLFTDKELTAVRIPSMLFLGERERDEMRGRGMTMAQIANKVYRNMPPPKYFLEVKGANHLSFNNRLTSMRAPRFMSADDEQIFDVIRRYSIAFLEKHVAGRKDPDHVLGQSDPMLTRYSREPITDTPTPGPETPSKATQRAEQDVPADADKGRRRLFVGHDTPIAPLPLKRRLKLRQPSSAPSACPRSFWRACPSSFCRVESRVNVLFPCWPVKENLDFFRDCSIITEFFS